MRRFAFLWVLAILAAACGSGDGITEFNDLGREHVGPGDAQPTYNSDPPTSGPHAPNWSRCGVTGREVPDVVQVHNLEHGTVIVQYSPDLSQGDLETLTALARGLGAGHMIVAPRADLDDLVVATAWTRMQRFSEVDIVGLRDFWLAYAQQGPETVPCPYDETALLDG